MPVTTDEKRSAMASALSIIRTVVDLRGQDLPRPLLVRFAWFCIGAVFVLASVRSRPSGAHTEPDVDRQEPERPAANKTSKPRTAASHKSTRAKEKIDA